MPFTDVIDISDSPIEKEVLDLQNVPQDEYADFATKDHEQDYQEMVSTVC